MAYIYVLAAITAVLSVVVVALENKGILALKYVLKTVASLCFVMIALLFFSIFITKNMHNESISLVYGLLIAALVTGYCALFICSHVDIFVEKISTHIGKEWKPA